MAYYYPPEESDENTALMDIAELTEGEDVFRFSTSCFEKLFDLSARPAYVLCKQALRWLFRLIGLTNVFHTI